MAFFVGYDVVDWQIGLAIATVESQRWAQKGGGGFMFDTLAAEAPWFGSAGGGAVSWGALVRSSGFLAAMRCLLWKWRGAFRQQV